MRSKVTNETREQAIKLYQELIKETIKEEGCISYELFYQLDDENCLALFEEWESRENLKAHTKTEHFLRIVSMLSQLEIEDPILIYKKIDFDDINI